MKKQSNQITASRRSLSCTAPALGAQVPDYIVERLDDEQAEVVENHLLDCKYCREMYLTIVRIQEAGRRRRMAADQNKEDALAEAKPQRRIDSEA